MTADLHVRTCTPQDLDRDEWEELLDRAAVPPGLPQRFDSARVDGGQGIRTRFLAARSREGRLVGGARVTVEPRFPARHLEMIDGPEFLPGYEEEVTAAVSKSLRDLVQVVDSGLIRPTSGHPWHLDRFGLHRSNAPVETVLVDLGRSEEELWRGVDHSVRQGVRKAKEHGLTVREVTLDSEIEGLFPLIERFGRQRDFAIIGKDRLLEIHRLFHPVGRSHILVCEAGSRPAGVAVIVLSGPRAGLLVVASDPEFSKVQMVSLLDWEAMRFCKARGAASFDFLGLPPVGSGLEGLRRFKLKWGGRVVPGEEYLEGVLFRFATNLVRRWPKAFEPILMQRGPFRNGRR